MENQTELRDTAVANGIIRYPKPNQLFCFLCSVSVSKLDTHILKQKHKLFLERFNSAFVNQGEKLYCKKCSFTIERWEIKRHGAMHKIVPWYKSKPSNRIFFRNHTVQVNVNYYCFLCERTFDYWDTANSHFEETNHRRRIKMDGPDPDSMTDMYTSLVNQGSVPGPDKTIVCKICDKTGLKIDDIRRHFKTAEHKRNRVKFMANFEEREDRQSSENEDSDSDSSDTEESTSKLVKADPAKEDKNPTNIRVPYERNMICNFSLQKSTEEAIPERKKSAKEEKNVSQDQRTEKTDCPKIPPKEKPPKSPDTAPEPLCQDPSINYIVSHSSKLDKAAIAISDKQKSAEQSQKKLDFYCSICYCEIPDLTSVKDHLNGKRHNTARKKYDCDRILLMNDKQYYCSACDCTFFGSGTVPVYRHITSNRHLNSDRIPQGNNHESQNSMYEVESSMEAEEAFSKSLYIVKQNAKKSFCQICDDTQYPVATKNINEHITSQRHKIALKRYGCDNIVLKENGNYFCGCCHCELPDLESVYLHIKEKRHMSSLITVCNKQEKQRGKRRVETPKLPEDITKQINRSSPSKFHEIPQRSMTSNFTAARQNSEDSVSNVIGNGVEARNRLEDVYQTPSENRLDDKVSKQNTPLHSSNTIPDGVENCKQPELTMITSSMATELSRILAQFSTKEIKRKAEEPQRRVEKEPTREFQVGTKKFYCVVCDACTPDQTELHAHMASHYTEDFVQFKRNGGDGTTNGCSANDRTAEQGNYSGEGQQAPKTLLGQQELLVGRKITNGVDNGPVNGSNSSTTESFNPKTAKIGIEDDKTDSVVENLATLESNTTSKRENRSQKIAKMKNVAQLLDFDHDYIYDLDDKLKDVELGMELGLVADSSKIYCLICRMDVNYTLDNYTEHLYSVDHCSYLEEMETDNALFKDFADQFSDLDLAKEYMQEISDDTVRCIICDEEIRNNDRSLEGHIYHEVHERKCEETRAMVKKHFEEIKPRMRCNWYDVQTYWCTVCKMITRCEVDFVKHLRSTKHAKHMKKPNNVGKRMIFDFCASCALLWYGYRCTHFYHNEIDSHKWLKRDGHYALPGLAKSATSLLASPEQFIDDKIKYIDVVCEAERTREVKLIRDLEKATKVRFPRAKAYAFGSRVSGLSSPDSDIDVFLDCRNVYNGNNATKSQVLFFMDGVRQCLTKDPQSWDVEELLTNCRSPIIKACHRATGLSCDISFENGLAVENTKLIKTFNQIFPTCRRITLFLKQWLLDCDLSGSNRITNYALYWYVIFYLQKESILPSVATLIARRKKSHLIEGWEVGVTHDFPYNEGLGNFTFKEFLKRFFTFYGDFDFRYDVACPLLGEVVKKRAFLDPHSLPKEMKRYVAYVNSPGYPESFRIDSPMCIQDPFDLQHNLTKAVSKVYLNRFRKCCAKSLDLLWSS